MQNISFLRSRPPSPEDVDYSKPALRLKAFLHPELTKSSYCEGHIYLAPHHELCMASIALLSNAQSFEACDPSGEHIAWVKGTRVKQTKDGEDWYYISLQLTQEYFSLSLKVISVGNLFSLIAKPALRVVWRSDYRARLLIERKKAQIPLVAVKFVFSEERLWLAVYYYHLGIYMFNILIPRPDLWHAVSLDKNQYGHINLRFNSHLCLQITAIKPSLNLPSLQLEFGGNKEGSFH